MKIKMNRIIGCLLLACTLLAASGCAEDDTPEAEPEIAEETEIPADIDSESESVVYVSLGDSIAHGYGLENMSAEAYTAVIADKFESDGILCEACNFGVDGQKSGGLISYIDANEQIAEKLAAADYVSISIGANNILYSATSFIRDYNDFKTNPSTSFTSDDITAKFKEFNESIVAGLDDLQTDIPILIDKIRSYNEDCEILFMTCYNPYGAVKITLDWGGLMTIDFAALSDTCVSQMDDIIRSLSDECGYQIADVYTAFDGKAARLINASPVDSGDTFDLSAIDPHPNKIGHALIADVIYEVMVGA